MVAVVGCTVTAARGSAPPAAFGRRGGGGQPRFEGAGRHHSLHLSDAVPDASWRQYSDCPAGIIEADCASAGCSLGHPPGQHLQLPHAVACASRLQRAEWQSRAQAGLGPGSKVKAAWGPVTGASAVSPDEHIMGAATGPLHLECCKMSTGEAISSCSTAAARQPGGQTGRRTCHEAVRLR
jgi:hypothetical protein